MALVPFPSASRGRGEPDDDPHIELTDVDELDGAGAKMSFLEHLEELRRRLVLSVIGLAVGCVIAFLFVARIQRFIMAPLQAVLPHGERFVYQQGFEPFMLTLKIGALAGLIVASPFIMWQLWLFIAPGLYAREKRFAIPFVLFSTLFFVLGAMFSHYVAFPWTWRFFLTWETDYMRFLPSIGPVFSLYVKMLLGFGIVFQMPTLVFFLARMGLMTAGYLIRNAKYAVLIIFIVAGVVSPGTDVVSQLIMAVPMIALYALSILVAWLFAQPRAE